MQNSRSILQLATALILSFFLLNTTPAFANDFLDVDEAFQLKGAEVKDGKILVNWEIADGYYLYQKRISINSTDLTLGETEFPKATVKDDPNFGKTKVFFDTLTITQPFFKTDKTQAEITVKYQGCEEVQGVCYPPQTRKINLAIPAQANSLPTEIAGFSTLSSLNDLLSLPTDNQLLPASEAFKLTTSQTEQGELILNFQVANDYYLYKDKITVSLQQGSAKIGNLQLPDAIKTDDPVFGKVEVYTSNFQAILPISDVIGQTSLVITYQGCSATSGVCYPPEKKEVLLDPKLFGAGSPSLSETDTITKALQDNSIWVVILTFFIFGLLLSLTPCVFPMIPILSSIIAGQGDKITTSKAFSMSLVYVLAMSITYTTAGVLAGIFGENLQVMLQNPWIIASFAIIFVILAFSMFGFYELQLPSKLQTKITNTSNKQKSGSYTGVAVMGFLSALIVGPCVAPPLAGALIYIGQTGDAFLGGAALFAMSMGMGMILLIIGTSAGKFIPKAGVWMDNVKSFFGVTLLAVALWMADRILPDHISLILWAALLIGSGVYLGALNSTEGKSGWHKLFKTSGLLLLIYGVIVLVGASAGSNDLLKPLKVFQGSGSATTVQQEGLDFKKIKSIADVDAILATGQPVMLDFYADWCISCIEMEKFTFTDKNVQQSLVGITLLKADVTANDEIDKALMKKYGIIGPPAILFFVNGQEIKNQRVVGFKNAEDFIIHIQNSFKETLNN